MGFFKRVLAAVCTLAVTATIISPISAVSDFANAETVQRKNAIAPLANEELPMEGTCGENLTWVLDDEGTLTISGMGDMDDYGREFSVSSMTFVYTSPWHERNDIKSVLIKDGVTSIGSMAFQSCSALISVTIPNGVTSIGGDAFVGCSSLTSVTIPNSVTSIGDSAFSNCSSLTSVNIPDSVTIIRSAAFNNCSSLTSVTIPNGVTSITEYAFHGCSSLTSVTIPDSVTGIYNDAFEDCTSLTSVTIPNSVTKIGYATFRGCSSLKKIEVGSQNKNYSSIDGVLFNKDQTELFCYPAGKKGTSYKIPNNVTSIGDYAFYGCSSLTNVTTPNSLTSIGNGAFKGCSSLKSVTIPNSVSSIGSGAFYGCGSLTNVTIPSSVASILTDTFWYCSSLEKIEVGSQNKICSSIDGVLFNKNKTQLVCYPAGKKDTSYEIPDSVTNIYDLAFYGCNSLTSVTIPNSVTSIGDHAFEGCSSLKSVIFNGTMAEWDEIETSWWGNSNLENAEIICTDGNINQRDTTHITVSFREHDMDIVWKDSLFSHSPYEYDNDLAIAALTLSGAAESKSSYEVETVLRQMGFDNDSIVCNKYGEFNPMQPAYAFATKTITINGKAKTLVCVTVRGSTTIVGDWVFSDFVDGATQGFTSSTDFLHRELLNYLNRPEFASISKDDMLFFITGHSLGGAVAGNLTTRMIDSNAVPQENIFAYTFASPNYFHLSTKSYNNLFEIINTNDIVPKVGLGSHFGVEKYFTPATDDFYSYWHLWAKGILLPLDRINNHLVPAYMAYLLTEADFIDFIQIGSTSNHSYLIGARCPVDVEIYDSSDTLIAKVTDNKIDESVTSDSVFCKIEGDEKYFFVESDKEIYVKFTGTDSGTMEYSVQKLKSIDEVVTEEDFVAYETVVLEEGKTFYSEIKENDDTANVSLFVVDPKTNQSIKTVGFDGTEVSVDSQNTYSSTSNNASNSQSNSSMSGTGSNDLGSNNLSIGVTVAIVLILLVAVALVVIFRKKNRK